MSSSNTDDGTNVEDNIIDGKKIAEDIRREIKAAVDLMAAASSYAGGGTPTIPGLAVILVGTRRDSQTYVNMKQKACAAAGLYSTRYDFADTVNAEELLQTIATLNADESIHGILIQLPLPKHLDADLILNSVAPEKDVDGLHPVNVAKLQLYHGGNYQSAPFSIPCTPLGCLTLLDRSNVVLQGAHCVVLGRSHLVGLPMARLLLGRDATVTIVHSKTKNPASIVQTADVVVAAIGQAEFVPADWIKEGAVVIDVGINSVDVLPEESDPSDTTANKKKKSYKLVGDVDFAAVAPKCSKITPVPGGVGPMTIAMLLQNTLRSCQRVLAQKKGAADATATSTVPAE
jgi:5,10-methylene-tetrahydrofolate dehydrogenase/methenyl tetrahydrofolate cyclohydrolase